MYIDKFVLILIAGILFWVIKSLRDMARSLFISGEVVESLLTIDKNDEELKNLVDKYIEYLSLRDISEYNTVMKGLCSKFNIDYTGRSYIALSPENENKLKNILIELWKDKRESAEDIALELLESSY